MRVVKFPADKIQSAHNQLFKARPLKKMTLLCSALLGGVECALNCGQGWAEPLGDWDKKKGNRPEADSLFSKGVMKLGSLRD